VGGLFSVSAKPRLQDVANLAGVSIGTASHALNNKSVVSPETRERVLLAATQLGYNLPSRTFQPSPKTLSTVGVLVKQHAGQDVPIDTFYGAVLSGAEHECKRNNISLLYSSVVVDEMSNVVEWTPLLEDPQVDGWLILGAFLQDTMRQLEGHVGASVVLVDSYAPHMMFDTVVINNEHGAYCAVSHLIEQGHRHIGLIGSAPNAYPSIRERRAGYLRALNEHGLTTPYIEDSPLLRTASLEATKRLLTRHPEITAIFACNDDTAMAVMRAAYELGRRVPDDLSVVGFDNMEFASEIIPPLTTVHVDKMLMGALSVRQLIDRRQHPTRVPVTILVSTRMVIRDSVRTLSRG